ncbi:MAG: sulfatase-like hydrolase/transferase [Candidatus Rariloculaceae bacterium]
MSSDLAASISMISRLKRYLGIVVAAFFATATISGATQAAPNILLIIGDDMGVETLASYGLGENPPKTATLDEMARQGMRFTNFWTQPLCSPTRAAILTGRYGFRTGIGRAIISGPGGGGVLPENPEIPEWASPAPSGMAGGMAGGIFARLGHIPGFVLPRHGLLPDEYTLPMAFNANPDLGYATAAIGKWHLAGTINGWIEHPNRVGFDHFSGLMNGAPAHFFSWNKVINGVVSGEIGYTPVDKADDAIDWIAEQGDEPWFLWFAFNLAHTPIHLPPEENWQSDHSNLDSKEISASDSDAYFDAMIEAMDTQIGRLLGSMDAPVRDNTYVIFLGDNGTTDGNVRAPFREGRAKSTIYEGGVNTPLIITGPGIEPGTVPDALVNASDLFVTIMEMARIDVQATVPEEVIHDSVSFMPVLADADTPSPRDWLYADMFLGGFAGVESADYAMRNERYKLLRFDGEEEFYDLQNDPYEYENLLSGDLTTAERIEYETLRDQITELRAEAKWPFGR